MTRGSNFIEINYVYGFRVRYIKDILESYYRNMVSKKKLLTLWLQSTDKHFTTH